MTENPNVTREGVEVLPGQVWEDLDKRMGGRRVRVIGVDDGKARVRDVTAQKGGTRLSVSRMHRSSTGFARVIPEYPHPMQQDVALFHRAFGLPDLIEAPSALPEERIELRVELIHEEGITELRDAIDVLAAGADDSPVAAIDALIDTLYVSLGGLVEMGAPVMGLALDPRPSRPGISIHSASVAASYAIEDNLIALGRMLREGLAHESSQIFSRIAEESRQALLWAGYDPQPYFDEVQRANMSKLGADGKPVHSRGMELDGYPKGKVLKGPNYVAPDLARVHRELCASANQER